MKPSQLDLLVLLAEQGAASKSVALTTTRAASALGVSQQTASRWMNSLAQEGLITHTPLGLRLTSQALQKLERIKTAFQRRPTTTIEGIVVEGLKDGAYYMSQPEYQSQFKHLLHFTPFVGTLNLKLVSPADIAAKQLLEGMQGLFIRGFKRGKHVFGAVKCFRARINARIEGAVIMPVRTHHASNVLEVIAPVKLRDKLRLRNGSRVVVDVDAG